MATCAASGRVQTPTLALIVARERERLAFIPGGLLGYSSGAFDAGAAGGPHCPATASWRSWPRIPRRASRTRTAAKAAMDRGAQAPLQCHALPRLTSARASSSRPCRSTPPRSMAAASAEGLSPARTMRIAESLYMDGYISYPRVDNTVYPSARLTWPKW